MVFCYGNSSRLRIDLVKLIKHLGLITSLEEIQGKKKNLSSNHPNLEYRLFDMTNTHIL